MTTLMRKLQNGERLIGCIQIMASADVTEVLSTTGIDMLMIDQEHGVGNLGDLVAQLRALKGCGIPALVRVPTMDEGYVHRLLDAGVTSILFPAMERAEDVRKMVRTCHYPPAGVRGAGGGLRATAYDSDMGYYASAKDEILVGVQIESAKGVEAAAEICAVEGVGLVVIGPRDLSASIGKLGQFGDEKVKALFAEAEKRILATGVPMGSVVYQGLTAQDMFTRGHRVVLAGTDIAWLARSARAAVESVKK